MEVESDNEDGKRKCPGAHMQPLGKSKFIGLVREREPKFREEVLNALKWTLEKREALQQQEQEAAHSGNLARAKQMISPEQASASGRPPVSYNDWREMALIADQAARDCAKPALDRRAKEMKDEFARLTADFKERTARMPVRDRAEMIVRACRLGAAISRRHAAAFAACRTRGSSCTPLGQRAFTVDELLVDDQNALAIIAGLCPPMWLWLLTQLTLRGAAVDLVDAGPGDDIDQETLIAKAMALFQGNWPTANEAARGSKRDSRSIRGLLACITLAANPHATKVALDISQALVIDRLPHLGVKCNYPVSGEPLCATGQPDAELVFGTLPASIQELLATASQGIFDAILDLRQDADLLPETLVSTMGGQAERSWPHDA